MPTTVIKLRPEQLGVAIKATSTSMPKVVLNGIRVSAERARAHLVKNTPVDRGVAKNAWTVLPELRGARLVNHAPYIGILERGARPHDVSAEGWMAIFRWVLRHPALIGSAKAAGQARSALSRGRSKASSPVSWAVQQATEVTNAIVWKLKHEGQEGHWMVRDGMPLFKKWLAEDLNRMIVAYIRAGGRL